MEVHKHYIEITTSTAAKGSWGEGAKQPNSASSPLLLLSFSLPLYPRSLYSDLPPRKSLTLLPGTSFARLAKRARAHTAASHGGLRLAVRLFTSHKK